MLSTDKSFINRRENFYIMSFSKKKEERSVSSLSLEKKAREHKDNEKKFKL